MARASPPGSSSSSSPNWSPAASSSSTISAATRAPAYASYSGRPASSSSSCRPTHPTSTRSSRSSPSSSVCSARPTSAPSKPPGAASDHSSTTSLHTNAQTTSAALDTGRWICVNLYQTDSSGADFPAGGPARRAGASCGPQAREQRVEQGARRAAALGRRRRRDRTFEAPRLDRRAGEQRAGVAERAGDERLPRQRQPREGVARLGIVIGVAAGEPDQHLVEPSGLALQVDGARPGGIEIGAPRGLGERVAKRAEAIDEAQLPGGAAVPDTALADFVDPCRRQPPRLGDQGDEAA